MVAPLLIPSDSIGPEHLRRGSIRAEHMAAAANGGRGFTEVTTTSVDTWFTVTEFDIFLPTPHVILEHVLCFQLKHSAAGRYSLNGALFENADHSGIAVGTLLLDTIDTPFADRWYTVGVTGWSFLDLADPPMPAGIRRLALLAMNRDAGTLTIGRTPYSGDFTAYRLQGY